MTRIYKNILTMLISLCLSFLLTEIGLRFYLGFHQRSFIESRKNDIKIIKTNPNCWNLRKDIRFQMPKPENNYRIFAFGGSVMEGGIYPGYKVNFMRFLELILKDIYPAVNIEVINLAKSGDNSSNVVDKLKLALPFSPDLFIICTGHNEYLHLIDPYLKKTRFQSYLMKSELYSTIYTKILDLYPMLKSNYFSEERAFIDVPICNEKDFREIQSLYGYNLNKIIQICNENSINLIMVAPAGNYVDWQPNRSVRWRVLEDYELNKWDDSYKKACRLLNHNKWHEALACLKVCDNIDSTFAQTKFDIAEVLVKLGNYSQAKKAYKNAINFDGAPKIANSFLINKMSQLCDKHGVPFLNANKIFESQSLYNLNDPKYFVDAQHLSWQGDVLIAKALREVIVENAFISPKINNGPVINYSDIELLHRFDLTRQDSVKFLIGRANWFLKATESRWEYSRRLSIAKEYIDKALMLAPEDTKVLICYALWACLSNEPKIATQLLKAARTSNKELFIKIIRSPWVIHILKKVHLEYEFFNC